MQIVTMYEELNDLIELFHNIYTPEGERTFCFELVKQIIDGAVKKADIPENERIHALKLMEESFEWFWIIGGTTQHHEEILNYLR